MIENTFLINSSLDNTKNLLSKYVYDENKTNLPIVVMIHGFNLTIDAITGAIMRRIAQKGFFVVAIGMRGRKGATGSRDASARELHDIYDGINHIKANFPVSDKVIISGYSGGGGNALGFAIKFPYVANTIVNHFGMVDYGFNDVESWYIRNPQYQSGIQNFVGHARTPSNLNYYRSRNAHEALKNIQAKVYNYHDNEDTGVSVELTNYLTSRLQVLNKPHQTKISSAIDSVRYLHNMSVSEKTEDEWLPHGIVSNKPVQTNEGSFRVIGYIVTDHFKLLLDNLDNHVADVEYNLLENEFTITPLTGSMTVKVIRNNLQQVLSVSDETTFVFDGEEIPDTPVFDPADIKKIFVKENGQFYEVKNVCAKQNNWNLVKR